MTNTRVIRLGTIGPRQPMPRPPRSRTPDQVHPVHRRRPREQRRQPAREETR